MWTHDKARKVIHAYVDALTDGAAVILDEETLDRPYGSVFFYQSRAYLESGALMHQLVGNAPIIFNRFSGELKNTGTAKDVHTYLSEYEGTLPSVQLEAKAQLRARPPRS
jgi:hypothetical protein